MLDLKLHKRSPRVAKTPDKARGGSNQRAMSPKKTRKERSVSPQKSRRATPRNSRDIAPPAVSRNTTCTFLPIKPWHVVVFTCEEDTVNGTQHQTYGDLTDFDLHGQRTTLATRLLHQIRLEFQYSKDIEPASFRQNSSCLCSRDEAEKLVAEFKSRAATLVGHPVSLVLMECAKYSEELECATYGFHSLDSRASFRVVPDSHRALVDFFRKGPTWTFASQLNYFQMSFKKLSATTSAIDNDKEIMSLMTGFHERLEILQRLSDQACQGDSMARKMLLDMNAANVLQSQWENVLEERGKLRDNKQNSINLRAMEPTNLNVSPSRVGRTTSLTQRINHITTGTPPSTVRQAQSYQNQTKMAPRQEHTTDCDERKALPQNELSENLYYHKYVAKENNRKSFDGDEDTTLASILDRASLLDEAPERHAKRGTCQDTIVGDPLSLMSVPSAGPPVKVMKELKLHHGVTKNRETKPPSPRSPPRIGKLGRSSANDTALENSITEDWDPDEEFAKFVLKYKKMRHRWRNQNRPRSETPKTSKPVHLWDLLGGVVDTAQKWVCADAEQSRKSEPPVQLGPLPCHLSQDCH